MSRKLALHDLLRLRRIVGITRRVLKVRHLGDDDPKAKDSNGQEVRNLVQIDLSIVDRMQTNNHDTKFLVPTSDKEVVEMIRVAGKLQMLCNEEEKEGIF